MPPAKRVVLHVGAPKTGTSYVQDLLNQNASTVREAGLLVPGTKRDQRQASWDLMGDTSGPLVRPGAWEDLAKQMADWPGVSVLSNESLGMGMDATSRHRFVAAFPDHEAHVLFTARDMVRQLTATWQEALKNRSTMPFADYFSLVSDPAGKGRHRFLRTNWLSQDAGQVLRPWLDVLPASNIHVVTLPQKGASSGVLWDRVAGLLGVSGVPIGGAASANASLDVSEAAVLRRLNAALAQSQPPVRFPPYWRYVKYLLANDILPTRTERRPIWLTPDQAAWAMAECQRVASEIDDASFDVVGSLSDLTPDRSPVPVSTDDVDAPDPALERDASIHALAGLVAHLAESGQRRRSE